MKSLKLSSSVGIEGKNHLADIKEVQKVLNAMLKLIQPTKPLIVDGSLGKNPANSKTVAAIKMFQKKVMGMVCLDGIIDLNGRTHREINNKLNVIVSGLTSVTLPKSQPVVGISEADFQFAAAIIGCEIAAVKAVSEVETSGSPFLSSGKPKILFEAHWFSKLTQHKYDQSHENISSRRWDRSLYKGGEKEYERLISAMALDREAALKSASWGRFQILGVNYKAAGFSSVNDFVNAIFKSESNHLNAFVNFLKSKKLDDALKQKNWAVFANGYNGSSYAENKYDVKLKAAYEKYSK